MKKTLLLTLGCTVLAHPALRAQEPAAKAPAEGALTTFTDRNAKDVPTQVARLTQEVFKLKTELIVSNFRQEYADRIRMQRVSYPANTADKEAIPGYLYTPAKMPAGFLP